MYFACIGSNVKWELNKIYSASAITIKLNQTEWCESFVTGSNNIANPLVRLTIKWYFNVKNDAKEVSVLDYSFEEKYILDMTDTSNEDDRLGDLLMGSFARNIKEFNNKREQVFSKMYSPAKILFPPIIENIKTLLRDIGY
jgi:hypothetical protein